MHTLLVVIYLLIVIALVVIVLLQRSEGGGFSSGNNSNFMTARGSKNALTRLTAILATCFFILALILVVMDHVSNSVSDVLDRIPAQENKAKAVTVPNEGTVVPTAPASAQTPDVSSTSEKKTISVEPSPIPQPRQTSIEKEPKAATITPEVKTNSSSDVKEKILNDSTVKSDTIQKTETIKKVEPVENIEKKT